MCIRDRAYINYYAVPIKDEKKQVCKVLCAVNPADTLANIINSPIFRGAGFSNIMNQNGELDVYKRQLLRYSILWASNRWYTNPNMGGITASGSGCGKRLKKTRKF